MSRREVNENELARLVQLACQAKLDACPGDHRIDLADSLPHHHRDVWLRLCAGDSPQGDVEVIRMATSATDGLLLGIARDSTFEFPSSRKHQYRWCHREVLSTQIGLFGTTKSNQQKGKHLNFHLH